MKPTSLMQMIIIAICFNLLAACDDGANSTATCGNNILESEEACDGDQFGGNTCVILGYSGGFLMCDQDCRFDVSACESSCGNGRVEAPFEECDDDNALDGDGCDLVCGIEPGWICDPETGCTPVCGDDRRVGDEECDGEQWLVEDCAGLAPDFFGGSLTCVTETCRFDTSGCNQCGDMVCAASDGEDREMCSPDCGRVTFASAGGQHSCAVLGDGSAWCWGNNQWGQLGVGNQFPSSVPMEITLNGELLMKLAAGAQRSCAVSINGAVHCWGTNPLGDGTTQNSLTPVPVQGLEQGVTGVAIGAAHICALNSMGRVSCWGNNSYSQLGIEGLPSTLVPVELTSITNVEKIVAGEHHTCALLNSRFVYCWGRNYWGQVGDGTTENRALPTLVDLNGPAVDISAGDHHTCAVLEGGSVSCWGDNSRGQLGDGGTNDSQTPVATNMLGAVAVAVSCGQEFTCALEAIGGIICWGANSNGQLGDGTTEDRLLPVSVTSMSTQATIISAGGTHACAVMTDGALWCWGNNDFGQLGNGSGVSSPIPVAVTWGM